MRKDEVYVVQHEYVLDDCDEGKFIGVYSTRVLAEQAVERSRQLPGFRDHPDDFFIDAYQLNEDHWTSGFVTDRPGN